MKITVVEEPGAPKEIVIRCSLVDAEIEQLVQLLAAYNKKLVAKDGANTRMLDPGEVLYCESVDDCLFVYTAQEVLPALSTLSQIEKDFAALGFIRCAKSMVVNLKKIDALKSENSGRIIATITNGERIVISRHYAKILRQKLLK
jgi:two-component system, LytTR family, response regulator LytT